MANLFMSSLTLPCHKWFDYISTDCPLAVVFREVQVYETPFTTHQTFAKHVTQIFLCAIKLQKHNFLVTITSTSFLRTFRMISKDPDLRLIKQISIYLLESFLKINKSTTNNTYRKTHIKCMITNKFVVRSLWPVNGILVTSLFGGKLQVSDDSKSKRLQNPS